jgi:6-phosphogluconate dehydrogenase
MKLAMVGLGKMGMGLARRLVAGGHQVVGFSRTPDTVREAEGYGVIPAFSLEEAVNKLDTSPRIVWLMLPAGETISTTLQQLVALLGGGDIVVEGGNSHYKQSIERATMLRYKGIHMLDAGVSGGIWGLENGFNLMIGGDENAYETLVPIFETLAPPGGYQRVGPSGAGHFAKMVHNGIEYGMMEAIAEGFEILAAKEEFGFDLEALSRLWMNGSVIRSWLLELTGNVLEEDPALDWVEPYVVDSGEGRWTVIEAIDLDVPLPVITLALQMRFRSRQDNSYAARLLAALRNQFGGHAVRRREENL